MPLRSKQVQTGEWRTLEWYWNQTTTAWFRYPAGADVRVRYSAGWFGVNRQTQTLDGSVRRLLVSRWSAVVARLQMNVKRTEIVEYFVEPGNVANLPPGFTF